MSKLTTPALSERLTIDATGTLLRLNNSKGYYTPVTGVKTYAPLGAPSNSFIHFSTDLLPMPTPPTPAPKKLSRTEWLLCLLLTLVLTPLLLLGFLLVGEAREPEATATGGPLGSAAWSASDE